jgi:hypothetical protein
LAHRIGFNPRHVEDVSQRIQTMPPRQRGKIAAQRRDIRAADSRSEGFCGSA